MKDAYYFPHDSNARHDPKIVTLCSRYGLVAYACYFQVIEMLREQKDYRISDKLINALTMPWQSYNTVSATLQQDVATNILNDMFLYGLLEKKDGFISSPSLIQRMSHMDDLRRKRSESGKKGAAKLWQRHGNAKALSSSIVKDSKVNNIKEKNIKTTTLSANADESASKVPSDIQKVIEGWKVLTGIDRNDKGWDKVHYPRYAKSAKSLLTLFGSVDRAWECMEHVYNELSSKKLECTIETVVKRSDTFKEQLARGGV